MRRKERSLGFCGSSFFGGALCAIFFSSASRLVVPSGRRTTLTVRPSISAERMSMSLPLLSAARRSDSFTSSRAEIDQGQVFALRRADLHVAHAHTQPGDDLRRDAADRDRPAPLL